MGLQPLLKSRSLITLCGNNPIAKAARNFPPHILSLYNTI